MRNLGLLILVCIGLFFAWTTLTPSPPEHSAVSLPPSGQGEPQRANRPVTLSEVTAKSKDTLETTATYLGQEKEKIQARMSVTLQKLDQQIARLRSEAGQAEQQRKNELNLQISDLQASKARLIDMREHVGGATETAWNAVKQNWNRMEIDINAHLSKTPNHTGSPTHE